jgi:pimeloyl-ACP methyl ester carboxylesterase
VLSGPVPEPQSGASDSTPPRRLTVASDGLSLAGLLFLPRGAAAGAVLVCHGAGSSKENHAAFAAYAAGRGLAALAFDFRGHGESAGAGDDAMDHDVVACARRLLAESGAPWVAARGSSMGGYLALHAAAGGAGLFSSVVAICPADEATMLGGLDELDDMVARGDPDADAYGRFDGRAMRRFFAGNDLVRRVAGIGGVLLVHCRDDDVVPFTHSKRLLAALAEPKRLMALPSGGHGGAQHDRRVHEASVDWILGLDRAPAQAP